MRKKFIFSIGLILIISLLPSISIAVTATVSPTTVNKGQAVTVTARWDYEKNTSCSVWADFGEGGAHVQIPCTTMIPAPEIGFECSGSVQHVYNNPGNYQITVYNSKCVFDTPNSVTLPVTVNCTPLDLISQGTLPEATVGEPYSYTLQTSGGEPPIYFTTTDPSFPSWLMLNSTTGQLYGTPTTGGILYNFTVTASDSCVLGSQNVTKSYSLSVKCHPLQIVSPQTLPEATLGIFYSFQLQVSGGFQPFQWTLVSGQLPPGLTLTSTGFISGTPTQAGTFTFSLRVKDSCGEKVQKLSRKTQINSSLPSYISGVQMAEQTFTITVKKPPCEPLSIISNTTLPSGTVGVPYNYRLLVQGGELPYTWRLISGSLPPGVTFSSTGQISGIPQTEGTYRFTVSVEDSCSTGKQFAEKTFVLSVSVNCPDIVLTTASNLPEGKEDEVYNYQITVSGGTPPLTFTIIEGSLPPGITLTQSGLLTGIPQTTGTYMFTVRVQDSCPVAPRTGEKKFTLVVTPTSFKISVTVTPTLLKVPRGLGDIRTVFYSFTTVPPVDIDIQSDKGVFLANGEEIGQINTPIKVSIHNGTGHISETVKVPVSVIKHAERLGTTKLKFRRIFNITKASTAITTPVTQLSTVITELDIVITTEAGAEFRVTRIQLYFKNRRAEITVKRNDPTLKAYVDIRYTGNGLLEGYWEVDGRIISHVKRHLVYGRSVTLETPEIPPLPTFDTGTHILRFVLTSPEGVKVPEALYFVTSEEFREIFSITLLSPEEYAKLKYVPPEFTWQGAEGVSVYLIQFFDLEGDKPIFSAYTRQQRYKVPEKVFRMVFQPEMTYRWQVKGFDETDSVSGESPIWDFSFEKLQFIYPNRQKGG
jgi:hypothetical protein